MLLQETQDQRQYEEIIHTEGREESQSNQDSLTLNL